MLLLPSAIMPLLPSESLVEYELFGVFEFKAKDTGGSNSCYEPFGDFSVEIKHRTINNHYHIWHGESKKITVKDGKWYTQPFKIRFQESQSFIISTEHAIILHGSVHEGNYLVGNYEGSSFKPSILSMGIETSTYEGDEESEGEVRIKLGLRCVGKPEEGGAKTVTESMRDEL